MRKRTAVKKELQKKIKKIPRIKNIPGKGVSHEELYNKIMDSYMETNNFTESLGIVFKSYKGNVTIGQLSQACQLLSEKAKEICENIFSEVFFKHSLIYSHIAREFKKMGNGYGENKAMQYREKLLGLSEDESNEFVINNEFEFIQKDSFDVSKLDDSEKERLELLLLKTKGIQISQKKQLPANG